MALDNIIVPDEDDIKKQEQPKEDPTEDPKEEPKEDPTEDPKEEPKEDGENQIEIDGVMYALDDDGNAVNDKGEIAFTKEAIDKMSDDTPDDIDNYLEAIEKASGIQVLDENGQAVKFENTIDGFAQRELAVKAIGEKEGFTKGFAKFLESNPDIAALVEYKNRYGTIEGYSNHTDYSKVEITDDENHLKDLIYKAEIQKGTSPDRAKRLVDFAQVNNTLKEDATESLNWLRKNQEDEIAAIHQKEQALYEEELRKEIAFYGVSYDNNGKIVVHDAPGSMYDMVVKTGKVGDYSIPQAGIRIKAEDGEKLLSREELFDYFARPVKEINGTLFSQAQLDEMTKLANPAELILRFITNLNGGIDQLVKNTMNQETIKHIRKLSSKSSKSISSKRTNSKEDDDRIVLPIK